MHGEGHLVLTGLVVAPALYFGGRHVLGEGHETALVVGGTALTLVGALFPDLDHPASTIAGLGGRSGRKLAEGIMAAAGHRGWLHSLLGAFFWGSLLYVAVSVLTFALVPGAGLFVAGFFTLGYVAHLVEDMFGAQGIPLFWPVRRRFRWPGGEKKGP